MEYLPAVLCLMKRVVISLAAVLLYLSSSSLAPAQTKRALVIGIGEQKDPAWQKINGDKDVPYVLELLNNAGYGQVITLINDEATKDGIVSAFQKLAQSCQKDDMVYVHFSGHGQQMSDVDGDETDDGLDECWIPYDAYRRPCDEDRGEKHLIDDEVNMLLTNVRDKIGSRGKMLVVVDACHSGDATRGDSETVRGVQDVFESENQVRLVNPYEERWITLSACASDQVNAEMKKPAVGKLTYAIYVNVNKGKALNNDEFYSSLRVFMKLNSASRPQRPEMTGETGKYGIADFLF